MRDFDIRSALLTSLACQHAGDPDTRIVEEMGVWSNTVRIDIAVINGELSGFELKSDRDTLQRLPMQADIYSKVFERVTLVAGSRHAENALSLVPSWWGVIIATEKRGGIKLSRKRAARRNPDRDAFVVAQMLWKTEAVAIMEAYGMAKGWKTKPAVEISRRLAEEIKLEELAAWVRQALKMRQKLGQMGSGQFDMSVNSLCDPRSGASGRPGGSTPDGSNLGVGPTATNGLIPWMS